MIKRVLCLGLLALALVSCEDDDDKPVVTPPPGPGTEVVFDPAEVPYQTLSEYNFFNGPLANLAPQEDVLPYDIINHLFSDYAKKKRFVWMPEGSKASYDGDGKILSFPESAVIIKNFYYENVQPNNSTQIIETRVMFMRNGAWEFAEYIWNDEQTDAELDMTGKNVPVDWINDNDELQSVNFRIPSESECLTCHKNVGDATPIGPKPQHLNMDYAYADGVKNQLQKWEEVGYLESGYPNSIVTTIPWEDETQDLEERFRSYIDINCAHCHTEGGHCDYRPMRLAFEETLSLENQGVCVEAQEWIGDSFVYIISSGDPNKSILYERMRSTLEEVRMPLMGRTLQHEEGLELIRDYIESLGPPC